MTSTLYEYKSEIVDNYFKSNALFVRLRSRNKVTVDGGTDVRRHFIYAKLGGGSYGIGDQFDTATREFMTDLILPWKRNYVPLSMDGLEEVQNRGVAKIFSYTDTLKNVAKMTLADNIGDQLYGDGSGNGGKDIDGLRIAVSDAGTYGGVPRATSGPGAAIKSYVNTTGGRFSFTMVREAVSRTKIGSEQVDLIICNENMFDKFWARSQPSEYNKAEDMRQIGFDSVRFGKADVVTDDKCPDGEIWGLNTNYIEYTVSQGRDFYLRGPFDIANQDMWTAQYLVYSNIVVTAPRLMFRIENVT